MLWTKDHTLFSSYFALIDGLGRIAVPYEPKAYSKKIRNVKKQLLGRGFGLWITQRRLVWLIDRIESESSISVASVKTGAVDTFQPGLYVLRLSSITNSSFPLLLISNYPTPDSPATRPFALFVRQFGSNESIAQQLLTQIQSWKAASPASSEIHIRAYSKEFDYKPLENEILLEKQWTKLAIVWSAPV